MFRRVLIVLASSAIYVALAFLVDPHVALLCWGLWIGFLLGRTIGQGQGWGLHERMIRRLAYLANVEHAMSQELAPHDPRRVAVAKEKGALMRALNLRPENLRVTKC